MATMEKLEGSKVKLTIEVAADEFEKAVQQAYLKTKKNYNVPGFRKGHAPRKVIENAYGWLVFFDEAFDIVYPEVYEAAVREHDITPVDRPDISILSCEQGAPVVFTAEVAVKPEVTLGAYKGIEVEKQEYNVTDEMVEAEIERLLKEIHQSLYNRALENRENRTFTAHDLDEFIKIANSGNCFIKSMWCGDRACEEKLKEVAGVSSRCMPLAQSGTEGVCPVCGKKCTTDIYWGVAY